MCFNNKNNNKINTSLIQLNMCKKISLLDLIKQLCM